MIGRIRPVPLAAAGIVTALMLGLPYAKTGSVGAVAEFVAPSLTAMAIFALVVIGLNVQWGYTGIFNFGVVGFFMVGAYLAAIVTAGPADGTYATYVGGFGERLSDVPVVGGWLPFVAGVVAAGVGAALLALVLALPTLRLREDFLAIATIGTAEVLRRIVSTEQGLVNGSRGLGGIPRPFAGWVGPEAAKFLFFGLAVAALAAVAVLVERGVSSPWGRVLRAIREDEAVVAAAGKDVVAFKLQGFVLGAAIMGAGGALYAFHQGAISPDAFSHFFGTFIVWAMLVVGGTGNTGGAILGAYVVWGFMSVSLQLQSYDLPAAVAARIPHVRDFVVGLAIVAMLLVCPRGLLPERARVSRWAARRTAAPEAQAVGSGD
jgi:branched-chain amino acid transport system permease protein